MGQQGTGAKKGAIGFRELPGRVATIEMILVKPVVYFNPLDSVLVLLLYRNRILGVWV
jgi:hypothetical protein